MTTVNSSNNISKATVPSGTSVANFRHPDFEPSVRQKKPFLSTIKKRVSLPMKCFNNIQSMFKFLSRLIGSAFILIALANIASPELLQDMPDTYWFLDGVKILVEWFFHYLRWVIESMIEIVTSF